MRKFRVMLMALAATAVIAAGQVGVAQAVFPICTGGGDDTGSPATLAGTYTFTFFGANVTNATPLAASGSVTLNGNGKVTGGIIRCNQYPGQHNTPITGGCYTINSDGTGFMAILTSGLVCGKYVDADLQIAVSEPYGVQFQFSSDANDVNSLTGYYDVFSGTANRP